ncbi:MAG: hypothetical protein CM15mP120_30480 [Pseudomonadota bacterium]|nr:MAG: hypothetical protein CM15mP120_30480 [Pseudomonadota bacterium]
MGVALNFLINNRDYVIPLVVEEPSIVAGLSGAARLARLGGGIRKRTSHTYIDWSGAVGYRGDPEAAMQAR